MIGMSLSHRVRQTQVVAQSLRLSHAVLIKVQSFVLGLRLELIRDLRDERYEPKATCPKCNRAMTAIEIVRGFNRDPNDYTTCCSACGHRFEPSLVCFGHGSSLTLPFFCAAQTLDQLPGKENTPPAQFEKQYPAIYRSAIFHHGGIRQAFAKVGLVYPFEDIADWKAKIRPFLGRLPDTVIAECVDKSVSIIRKMRRDMGVGRYTLRATLAEMGETS